MTIAEEITKDIDKTTLLNSKGEPLDGIASGLAHIKICHNYSNPFGEVTYVFSDESFIKFTKGSWEIS